MKPPKTTNPDLGLAEHAYPEADKVINTLPERLDHSTIPEPYHSKILWGKRFMATGLAIAAIGLAAVPKTTHIELPTNFKITQKVENRPISALLLTLSAVATLLGFVKYDNLKNYRLDYAAGTLRKPD